MSVDPCYALPISRTKLRLLFHIRMGSHLLPEQGWPARPGVPRHLRGYISCLEGASGDERHCVLDCPYFVGLWLGFAKLFDVGALRTLMMRRDL